MGKQKCGEKKGTANYSKHTASFVKHGGGGVMAWACMAVSGIGPLNFTDDLLYDDSSRMNLEGYKTILPINIQENATRFIGKWLIYCTDLLYMYLILGRGSFNFYYCLNSAWLGGDQFVALLRWYGSPGFFDCDLQLISIFGSLVSHFPLDNIP